MHKERQIIFNSQEVRATIDGRKTQFRRVVTVPWKGSRRALPYEPYYIDDDGVLFWCDEYGQYHDYAKTINCTFGQVGDRLWVRETWCEWKESEEARYKADFLQRYGIWERDIADGIEQVECWCPSVHMPRWASRITLEITGVRVERLQDISESDANAEGYDDEKWSDEEWCKCRRWFRLSWDRINAKRSPWSSNPWVSVVEFRKVKL